MEVLERSGVVGGGAGSIDKDDGGGDFAVGRLGRDDAFDDENILGFRDDAGAANLFQAHGRHAAGGEHDGVIFGRFDDGSEALIAVSPAAVTDFSFGKEAIGEQLDAAGTEAESDGIADAGGAATVDMGGRVENNERIAGALAEALFKKHEGIGGAAAADVIAHVHEGDGLSGGGDGGGDGFGGRGQNGDKFVAACPGATGKPLGGAGGEGLIVIGDSEEGGSHLLHVGVIKAERDAGREDAGPGEDLAEIVE